MKKPLLSLAILVGVTYNSLSQAPAFFKHPGILCSQSQLDTVKFIVAAQNNSSVIDGYNLLSSSSFGSKTYTATPYSVVHVIASGGNAEEYAFRNDAHAMYVQTIKWIVTRDSIYRDNAIKIADAWSSTCKSIVSEANHPNQGTLETSWAAPIWIAAAEMLKNYGNGVSHWSNESINNFKSFVRMLFTYINGPIASADNWYNSRYLSQMSAGVFLDSAELYNTGYNGVKVQIDSHISSAGNIPELTRDFVHSQYNLIAITMCAEIAYHQGDASLFTRSGYRLLAGTESYIRCVLGEKTPNYLSSSGWARHSAPYEILFARYSEFGKPAPNLENYVKTYNRPEDRSEDHFVGWLTATHAVVVAELPNSAKNIMSFTIPSQVGPSVIDTTAHTVEVKLPYGTDITELFPSITVPTFASITPSTGMARDFSSPVTYTITAQDGSSQTWTIIVATSVESFIQNTLKTKSTIWSSQAGNSIRIRTEINDYFISIYNQTGQLLLQKSHLRGVDNVDISGLKKGLFFICLTGKAGSSIQKLLIIND